MSKLPGKELKDTASHPGTGGEDFHCVSTVDDEFRTQLSPGDQKTWNHYAVAISVVSIVLTIILGCGGAVVAAQSGNIALFGFALNCFLDVLSTGVVLWRFWPSQVNSPTAVLRERERKASLLIAILFVIAALVIVGKSVAGLVRHEAPDNALASLLLACVSCALCLALAWGKLRIGQELCSASMRTDGLNSFGGAVISLGIFASWLVYTSNDHVWYVSFIVALVVAAGMLACGVRLAWKSVKRSPSNEFRRKHDMH